MSAKNAIDKILHDATGKRASGRELLVSEKRSILEPGVAAGLKEQWNSAGRDGAKVLMRLHDKDGGSVHYVTGWDGKDQFVALTESGLGYVGYRKLEKLTHDADWNPETRLVEIRAPLLRENMERSDVDVLLDRIKKTLTKSGKKRRKGRLRNMEKFFAAAIVDESDASPGPESDTEFEKVDEKDDRIPEAPKAPTKTKLPTGRFKESFGWDNLDSDGRPVRRGLAHPWMESNKTDPQLDKREHVRQDSEGKGSSGGATPGGNKTDAQLANREQIDVRNEDKGDPQLDKREHVRQDSEGKGNSGSATPGGNKCDAQERLRQLVRMNREGGRYLEDKAIGAGDSSDKSDDPDGTTYAGEKADKKEFGSRPKISVRHEAFSLKSETSKLFGPDSGKKSPEGAKKPLMMLVLMGKKAPKRSMSEGTTYCPRCGTSHPDSDHPKSKFGPMRGLFQAPPKTKPGQAPEESCPNCATKRAQGGGGLKLKVQMGKKGSYNESAYSRAPLNFFEGKTPDAFLANIEKMRAKSKGAKSDDSSDDSKGKFSFGKKDDDKSDDKDDSKGKFSFGKKSAKSCY